MSDVRDPYADDTPMEWVRCLMCGEVVEKDWLVSHVVDDCEGEPLYEDVTSDDPARTSRPSSSVDEGAGRAGEGPHLSSTGSRGRRTGTPLPHPLRSVD